MGGDPRDLRRRAGRAPASPAASASAAGWVWRHEAWNLNEVSASAQRSPRRSIRRAGSASLDMPAARPCGPSRMRRAPVKPFVREVGRHQAGRRRHARCAAASSRRRRAGTPTGPPPACRPSRRHAASARASRPQQMAGRGRGGEGAGGAGGVEDPVVRAAEELADADADLVAGDRRPPAARDPTAPSACATASAAGNTTAAGWNTEPLCTSSCSAKCEAAAFTIAANSGRAAAAADQDLATGPSCGPISRATRAIASTGRAPLPASAEPSQSRSRSSQRRTHRRGNALEAQLGGEAGERFGRTVVHGTDRFTGRCAARRAAIVFAGDSRARQDRVGVLAERRHRVHARRIGRGHARRQQRRDRRRPACRPRPSARAPAAARGSRPRSCR